MNSFDKYIKNLNPKEIIYFDTHVVEEKIKRFKENKNSIILVAGRISS